MSADEHPVNPDQPQERDPPGAQTLYFVVLGFLIVAVSVWSLQGFTYAFRQWRRRQHAYREPLLES